jgi:hypothetical protein
MLTGSRLLVAAAAVSSILCSLGGGAAYSRSENDTREQQEMLIWTGDYDGVVDGVLGAGTKQAIKAFQKRIDHPVSGTLTQAEAALLRDMGGAKKRAVRFERVDDHVTGVSVSMPLKLLSGPIKKTWGQNWSASDDSIDIDTFRYSGATIQQVCNRLHNFRGREIAYFRIADDWCVISGVDRDSSLIYVRAAAQNTKEIGTVPEIRGFSVRLAGEAREQLRSLPVAMSSTFKLIQIGQPSISNSPPQDLLKTPTKELKEINPAEVRGSGKCFNGLGDCPPSASVCLRDTEHCAASLPGNKSP